MIKPLSKTPHLTPSDLEGIPKELIEAMELSGSDNDEIRLLEVIDNLGGAGYITKIMVAEYKLNEVIWDRSKLMTKLYRMTRKGVLKSHKKDKGVYCLPDYKDA